MESFIETQVTREGGILMEDCISNERLNVENPEYACAM